MPMLIRSGATLRYEFWGESGPVVSLVNGYTRPLNDFRMLGRHLTDAGFRVVAVDNRGAGETTVTRAFTLDEMADDVLALWDELGVERAALLGVSMGGFIAQKVAARAPERVDRLVLVSTAAHQGWIEREEKPWSKDPDEVFAKLSPYFTDGFRTRNLALVQSMAKQIAKGVEAGGFEERARQQKAAVAGFDGRAALADLALPVLIVHGREDRIVPPGAAEELAAALPKARLAWLEDAGHLLLAEKPKELYQAVTSFLHD